MDADPRGRAHLLEDVLCGDDVAQWKERLRQDCLARLASQPTGRARLVRDVVEDADHVAFREGLRADVARRVCRARPWRRVARVAAVLAVALGAGVAGHVLSESGRDAETVRSGGPSARAAPWVVRTRMPAPVALSRSVLDLRVEPRARLDVVATRPLASRHVLASDRPVLALVTSKVVFVERVDDAGLFALLPGRPRALVETTPGAKRLVLLDPADEAAVFGDRPFAAASRSN
jgi:hypothetical protein